MNRFCKILFNGHGLHNMLSEVKEEYFSGLSNVEHDAIELPSQFM